MATNGNEIHAARDEWIFARVFEDFFSCVTKQNEIKYIMPSRGWFGLCLCRRVLKANSFLIKKAVPFRFLSRCRSIPIFFLKNRNGTALLINLLINPRNKSEWNSNAILYFYIYMYVHIYKNKSRRNDNEIRAVRNEISENLYIHYIHIYINIYI